MSRAPWYLKEVRPTTTFTWTPEMRVAVYTMRVKDELPIDEIRAHVERMIGRRPNRTRIHNLVRMMRKNMAKKCHRCGKPLPGSKKPVGSWLVCKTCRKEHSEYKKACREKHLNQGLCGICGEHPRVNGFRSCRRCLSETYRRRINEGLCGYCGKRPRAKGSIAMCGVCLELDRIKSQINKRKQHAQTTAENQHH